MTGNVTWRELYGSAMLELDPLRLQSRIEVAQLSIRQAMKDLTGKRHEGAVEEFEALSDALANLQTLQRVESRKTKSTSSQSPSPAEGESHETRVPKNCADNLAQTPVGYDRAAS
jgi:hypothetical protein